MLVDDAFNAENHQRKQNHGVEPHQIPVIGDKEAAEGIEHTERRSYGRVFAERLLEIIAEGSTRKRRRKENHCRYSFGHILVSEDEHDYRERAAQIVIEVAEKTASESGIPRIEEALHLRDTVIEFREERAILVIEIHSENGHIAERYETVADINYQHYNCRAAESEPTVFVVFKNSADNRSFFIFYFHFFTCLISLSF